ncbi:MAG: glutathione peroxidase [Bacteroidales bacterium]|nr:glutathione peroxidase [Bacteroidales bacterium]
MSLVKSIFAVFTMFFTASLTAQTPVNPIVDFYSLSFNTITGETFKFDKLKGKKVLIVNTASKCGYTPQFKGLEELSKQYSDNLVVIGFPSNDFGAQDPGSNSDIKSFCEENYGVTFMMMEKSSVKGSGKNVVHQWLTDKNKNGWNTNEPSWNFGKYLIDEKGKLIAFYPSKVKPMDPEIILNLKK